MTARAGCVRDAGASSDVAGCAAYACDDDDRRGAVPTRTICRVEVAGRVSSMCYGDATQSCLVSTIVNGAHVFNADAEAFYGVHLAAGLPGSRVEHYTHDMVGDEPVTVSCFVHDGNTLAFGSSAGNVTLVSRCSRGIVARYRTQEGLPVRTLHAMTSPPSTSAHSPPASSHAGAASSPLLLLCTQNGAELVDVERAWLTTTFDDPCARAVAAVPVTPHVCAVANYDGKVLLHDTRRGRGPFVVLSLPDQVTTLAVCSETQRVCAGTVAGRVFTLRCTHSAVREQALGTGKQRAPIIALAQRRHRIAAGDVAGQLALIDSADVADATVHWSAQTLLHRPSTMTRRTAATPPPAPSSMHATRQDDTFTLLHKQQARRAASTPLAHTLAARRVDAYAQDDCVSVHNDDMAGHATTSSPVVWLNSEVTAAVLSSGLVWAAFCASNRATSQVTVLPA